MAWAGQTAGHRGGRQGPHNDGTQPCGVKDGVGDGGFESALLAVAGGVGTSSAPFPALSCSRPGRVRLLLSARTLLVAGLFLSGRAGRGPGCTLGEKSSPLQPSAGRGCVCAVLPGGSAESSDSRTVMEY